MPTIRRLKALLALSLAGLGTPAVAQLGGISPGLVQQYQQMLQQPQAGASGSSASPASGTGGASRGSDPLFDSNPISISNRQRGAGSAGTPTGILPGDRIGDPRRADAPLIQPYDPKDRIEFQDFVLQSTGRDLPLFGSNLFRSSPSTFAPVDNVPVTADYLLGPGDEVLVRAWGQLDVDFSAIIDRTGTISIPKVGVVNLSGVRSRDLNAVLKTAFSRVFRNFELTASLGQLRSIQIFVVGQAKRPGTYTVSSMSSLVTALFAAGGPSSRGSMRSIQLRRGNGVVADIDLYELLVSGNKTGDAQLVAGDVIYIPPVGQLVAVTGSVITPALFELNGETSLADLIRWSGGMTNTAQGQKATVERIDQRRTRTVDEFSLDRQGMALKLRDGDLVTVFSVTPRFENTITLRGNVAQPGRYPWRPGMRVNDLIPSKEALLSRDFWVARSQIVGMDQGVMRILQDQQTSGTRLSVTDLAERPIRDDQDMTVGEAIRRRQIERDANRIAFDREVPITGQRETGPLLPGQQSQQAGGQRDIGRLTNEQSGTAAQRDRRLGSAPERVRLVDQITPSVREMNWDYAVIERLNQADLKTNLVPFNLGKAILEGDAQQNVLLQPGDVVTIFAREDIQAPQAKQTRFVRLEGEFASSGVYQILPGETLRQLVVRVGGVTPNAYLFGAEFTRESTKIQQQKNLTEALNRLEQDVQRTQATRSQNVTTAEDGASLSQAGEAQQALLTRLRQIKPTGRIVIELPEDGRIKDIPDLPLEDGDRLYVPPPPSMVNVFGSVYSENSFIYRPEKRFNDYLAQAGGPTKYADQSSLYLLRADGSVVSKRQSGIWGSLEGIRVMPGDTVVVPEELDRATWTRRFRDIAQMFYQFGLGAAAVRVLRN